MENSYKSLNYVNFQKKGGVEDQTAEQFCIFCVRCLPK